MTDSEVFLRGERPAKGTARIAIVVIPGEGDGEPFNVTIGPNLDIAKPETFSELSNERGFLRWWMPAASVIVAKIKDRQRVAVGL